MRKVKVHFLLKETVIQNINSYKLQSDKFFWIIYNFKVFFI